MRTNSADPRPHRRLKLGISLAAAATIVGGLLAIGGGSSIAQADTVNSDILARCTSPAGNQNVTIPAVVTDTPDPVTAGNQMTISYTTSYPSNVTNAFSIDLAESTWAMPAQVASIDAVNYTNTGPWTIGTPVIDNVAKTVKSTFTGGGTNKPPTPTITVTVTIDPAAGGQTADWKVFVSTRSISSNIPIFGTIDSTCTPRGTSVDQTLNSTTIEASGTTTTSSTSTTSTSTTSTTTTPPGPVTCTQTSSQDGWTKTIWWIGPGGLSNSNGTSDKMYSTDDGVNYFQGSFKFPVVGGACAEGGTMPAGKTVTNAEVKLTKTKNCICFGSTQRLHKITQTWSETNLRANNGPSINGTASATFSTPGLNNAATITSAQITADVQAFVTTPASNEGWSVRQRYVTGSDTGNNADPAGWATREDSTPSERPTLTITYTP